MHPAINVTMIGYMKAAAEMWACATVPKRLELLNYVVLEIETNAAVYETLDEDDQPVSLDFDIDSL